MDDAGGLTVTSLHKAFTREHFSGGPVPSRTTVGDRLAGRYLTQDFVKAVAAVCFPDASTRAVRIAQATEMLREDTSSLLPGHAAGGRYATSPAALSQLHRAINLMRQGLPTDSMAPGQRVRMLQRQNQQLREQLAEVNKVLDAVRHELDQTSRLHEKLFQENANLRSAVRELQENLQNGRSPAKAAPSLGLEGTGDALPAPVSPATQTLPLGFEAFYQQNVHNYLRYVSARTGSPKLAEEVVHEVFLTLLRRWQEFLGAGLSSAWAWKILQQTVQPHVRPSPPAFAKVMRQARMRIANLEGSIGLYQAIARLPERQFDVIVLRYVLGYSADDVARLMGISPSTYRAYRLAGRRRLARELGMELG
ncbi:sigma-70 family RNA polymerase sigma factor [Streptomyces shaanxiensis]